MHVHLSMHYLVLLSFELLCILFLLYMYMYYTRTYFCILPLHCRFTSELQQTIGSTTESMHSRTLGSVITLGKWHHLSISVLPVEMQPIYRVSFSKPVYSMHYVKLSSQ